MIDILLVLVACLLVWQVLLLAPMVPGKLIDTRNFNSLPRWQYNGFNIFLTSLSLFSLIIAGLAVLGKGWVFIPSLICSLLYLFVFGFDLFEVFPVVKDKAPLQLLILECISFASSGILFVVSLVGLLA